MTYPKIFIYFSIITSLLACDDSGTERKENRSSSAVPKTGEFYLLLDDNSHQVKRNNPINFELHARNEGTTWDSAKVVFGDGESITIFPQTEPKYSINSGKLTGIWDLTAEVYYSGGSEKAREEAEVISNVLPVDYSYEVVNKYPHDKTAFTQGLVYADGILYEGTGMKGASELRKVELKSGSVLKRKQLISSLFGEGITIYNDNLYQLTWKAGLALVYNKNTFEEISKLNYIGDGWGITNDSANLIMSDGTNTIKFLRPQDFSFLREIQVYDENGAVSFLNELEYIDGKIYANVWQKDIIVIINPKNGIVEGKINLYKLLPASEGKPGVLNGIAHDKEGKRIFVTGKYWPTVFEIRLKEKKTTSS